MATSIEINIWRPIFLQLIFVTFATVIVYLSLSLFASAVLVLSYLLSISFITYAFSSHFQTYVLKINGLRKTSVGGDVLRNPIFLPASSDPWKGLLIPREVDDELEEFFEKTFEKYIYTWYRNVSNDNGFLYELKSGCRFLVAVLLRRFQRMDLTDVILSKMLSCAVGHLDCFIKAKKLAVTARNVEDVVFEDYGANLHVAVYNRKSELEYLSSLSECVLPYILSKQHLRNRSVGHLAREILSNCVLLPIMDAIADPDVINHLLQLLFNKDPMVIYPQTNFDYVPILERFVSSSPPNTSVKHNIGSNLTEFYCLYPFMKFLKDEGAVSVLQFCLAIDDFNKTLLNPEISDKEVAELHASAKKVYETYMLPDAIDRLDFDADAVEEFQQVISGAPENVLQLQTKESLYKMYEYAFDLLENKYLPLFYRSEAHFEYLCGQRSASHNVKNSSKLSKKKSDFAGKLGEKLTRLRGVFQPASTVEGRLEVAEADLTDAVFEAEEMKFGTEDLDSAYGDIDDLGLRDLSAWRVSIPKVTDKKDEQGRPCFYYVIDVQRIDVTNEDVTDRFHWVVNRQHHEFYVLESKLIEFHGELVGIHLPSKKAFGSKRYEYLESRRAAFEEFLQRLLQRATFRSSELLFNFLSSTGDFTIGFLPDLNIGKIIKTVPSILVKERGQHIETFLQAFVNSGDSVKAKSSKVEFKDIPVQTPLGTLKQQKSLYKDNAGRKVSRHCLEDNAKRADGVPFVRANTVCDYVIYLGLKVFAAPRWLLQMAVAAQRVLGSLLEAVVAVYLDNSLRRAFVPQRIVNLVRIVRDIIYVRGVVPMRSQQQRLQRARDTLDMMRKYLPNPIVSLIGRENHDAGIWRLLECLQHPRLNKQLAYVLLDTIAKELFPELIATEEDK